MVSVHNNGNKGRINHSLAFASTFALLCSSRRQISTSPLEADTSNGVRRLNRMSESRAQTWFRFKTINNNKGETNRSRFCEAASINLQSSLSARLTHDAFAAKWSRSTRSSGLMRTRRQSWCCCSSGTLSKRRSMYEIAKSSRPPPHSLKPPKPPATTV